MVMDDNPPPPQELVFNTVIVSFKSIKILILFMIIRFNEFHFIIFFILGLFDEDIKIDVDQDLHIISLSGNVAISAGS